MRGTLQMNKKLKTILIVLAVIVVIGIIGSSSEGDNTSAPTTSPVATEQPTKAPETSTESTQEPTVAPTAEPTVEPTAEPTEEPKTIYESSTYKVGTDIPAGEYVILADGYMGYAEVSKDSTGELDSIIANENFDYNTIFTLKEGQYFKMTGAYAMPIQQVTELDTTKGGMFKVGVHLPAGEYKVEVDEDSFIGYGYVEVAKKSTHNLNDIVSNDNFEGSKYITVKEGQYLKLSGAHIVK